jgi:hypothetical protein
MYTIICMENLKGRALARPRHRWEDDIRADLREIAQSV